MTLYNLKKATSEETSYLPAIFGLLMFASTLLILLGQALIGSFGFIIILLLALFYSKTISEMRMSQFMKGMEGIETTSSPALKDILNLRFWAVYALNKGSRKAAFGCSLFQAGFMFFIFVLMTSFSDIYLNMLVLVPAAIVIFVMGWYEYESIFRKYSEQQAMKSSTEQEHS
ncbi:hypothetical protein J7W08_09155 [Methanococcoides orientis]|uniref:hypothetical protein n=1 Tax=Methanococcoides orientis TaxID=2822137 RepID=UPI001E57913E|nr:hypothetical protein [Methanococcoides orientis]UGV40252.1 hypothetical protein J7W08_09155 [Methanococcoides orientis]